MNKAELIDRLSTPLGSRRDATLAVEALVDVVIREVAAGGSVGITGFGTFERADRAPRTGRNPRTGESVPIPGTSTPRFRPGTYFKEVLSDPKALPAEGLAGGRAPAGGSGATQGKAKSTTTGGTRKKAAPRKTTTAKATASKATASKTTASKTTASKTTASKTTARKPAASKLVAAKDVAAVETKLKDSARKTLKKSHDADKKSKKAKDAKADKPSKSDGGKKKDKKSKKK
ncbi:HU family DNA-binding protein [Ornithinimicrobium faecis]|uniref:HU family DNA-binding protein n=1 Tax=Ornithinimicrobium faecis TaxID=2934158 RepID=UPI0021191E75|nr:HU family DNA-binding protein [Ornithinimicrobium sp. HY1745]